MIFEMSEKKQMEYDDIGLRIFTEIKRRTNDEHEKKKFFCARYRQVNEAYSLDTIGFSSYELAMCGNDKDEFAKYFCDRYLFSDYCERKFNSEINHP